MPAFFIRKAVSGLIRLFVMNLFLGDMLPVRLKKGRSLLLLLPTMAGGKIHRVKINIWIMPSFVLSKPAAGLPIGQYRHLGIYKPARRCCAANRMVDQNCHQTGYQPKLRPYFLCNAWRLPAHRR
jgi:hypothetical protein